MVCRGRPQRQTVRRSRRSPSSQIKLIEIELVQIPGVERRPQPGYAMAEIGGRAFQTSQFGEQLAEAGLGQRLEPGDRVPQRDEVTLEVRQIATSLSDGDQMPLVLLLGGRQGADDFGPPIPAARRLLHAIPLNPLRLAIGATRRCPRKQPPTVPSRCAAPPSLPRKRV